jgi:O-acetyl-ADP-ribose deacetylase (regulator of RNase III)
MNGSTTVDPATVLITTSGAMADTHKVKQIFHAAANYGQVGQGYIPIDYVARCVVSALKTAPEDSAGEVRSILFPLMATRSRGGAVLEERVAPLLNAAIEYLTRNPDSTFRQVYFLTYTDKELEVCQDILRADSRLKPLSLTQPTGEAPVPETPVLQGSPAGLSSGVITGGAASVPKQSS